MQATLKAYIGKKEIKTMVSTSDLAMTNGRVSLQYCKIRYNCNMAIGLPNLSLCQCKCLPFATFEY